MLTCKWHKSKINWPGLIRWRANTAAARKLSYLLLLLPTIAGSIALAHDPLPVETRAKCVTEDQAKQSLVVSAGTISCRARMAVYLDENGNILWFENVLNDPRRLIQTIPQEEIRAMTCQPKCFVCVGPRCGCVC